MLHRLFSAIRDGTFWRKVLCRCFYDNGRCRLLHPLWTFAHISPNKVVCISFNGLFHADNPALIADEMLKLRPDLDVVWLVSDGIPLPHGGPIRCVPLRSLRALWELATAHIWINNMRMPQLVPKKKGQFYVQTWHGSIALKSIEWDAADSLSPEYLAQAEADTRNCDLMLSGNDFFTQLCRRAFRFKGEVLTCGTPRMDILFHPDPEKTNAVRTHYGLTADETVILYAPTFRQNLDQQVYLTDFSPFLEAFSQITGKRTRILLRMHPNVQSLFRGREWGKDIVDAMDIPNIQDLYPVADYLITDYSSSMFEFALLGKPVFLLMTDYRDYVRERKLYFQPEELPFPVAFSAQDLVTSVQRTRMEAPAWREKVQAFFRRIGLRETGDASRLAAERLLREIPPPATP